MINQEAITWLNENDGIIDIKEDKKNGIESVSFFMAANNCEMTCYVALAGPINRNYLSRFFNLAIEAIKNE